MPLPIEWMPGDNVPPPVETECLVTYDAKNLYVAFRAHDPRPSDIRAHLMDRDDTDTLIQDDHVGMMIDTFNDERRAFQFRVNPLGVQADAIFSEQDGVEDFSWDMIWNAVGRITADGYIVEIALPLKQLRFPAGEGPQTWGFEAFRSWPRNVRHRISSQRRDRNKGCLLCQENKISGPRGARAGPQPRVRPDRDLQPHRRTARRPTDSALTSGDVKAEAGLTARWSMTSSMTLNGTINPDFSQVEADVAQLDVNQRFALFYPEKRPFFLEGIDYFTTPIQAVFTRTVADPYFGAKLTGKQGGNAMGLFVTRDRINNLLLPSNAELDERVARRRRDDGGGAVPARHRALVDHRRAVRGARGRGLSQPADRRRPVLAADAGGRAARAVHPERHAVPGRRSSRTTTSRRRRSAATRRGSTTSTSPTKWAAFGSYDAFGKKFLSWRFRWIEHYHTHRAAAHHAFNGSVACVSAAAECACFLLGLPSETVVSVRSCLSLSYRPLFPTGSMGLAGAILLVLSLVCLSQLRRRPYLTFGWLWYVGMLVPVIGLVQVGRESMGRTATCICRQLACSSP